jgi:stage III sporulation protein AB
LLKLAGAVLLIFAGILAGYMESHKLSVRVEKLEKFLRFLTSAKTEIRYSSMPVESIVQKYGEGLSFLADCAKRNSGGQGWPSAWNESVASRAAGEGFSKKDLDLLYGFGGGFGATDTEGQLSHISLYLGLTAEALKSAKEEREKKSRLYQMLGTFAGIASALLLC